MDTPTTPGGVAGDGSEPVLGDAELCARYERVPTAAINDVLRADGLLRQALPHRITGLEHSTRVAGLAFTVKGATSPLLENEMAERAAMLEAVGDHAVCVWDTSGDTESAQWGEIMTMAAMRRGCRGAVVDGGVRDTDRILGLGFPVFCRYRTSNGMLGRFRITGWQQPIRIGEVDVHPGDVVVGDVDGVIVVPRARAGETLLAAEEIGRNEEEYKRMVVDGLTPREVVARGGYF